MPVSVSLFALIEKTADMLRELWPEEFRDMVSRCETEPCDDHPYAALADWCREQGEIELADAFAWLESRRATVRVIRAPDREWNISGMPEAFGSVSWSPTFVMLVVDIARRIQELRSAL